MRTALTNLALVLISGLLLNGCASTASTKPIYRGSVLNGQPHGNGWRLMPSGERYEGVWASGKLNGKGIYTHPNGERYEGEWSDGNKHGHGTYKWPNGERYEGGWASDRRYGKGTHHWPDGRRYEGEYSGGNANGNGAYYWPNGTYYEGPVANDRMNGEGYAVALSYGSPDDYCLGGCSRPSSEYAVVAGVFSDNNVASVIRHVPCGRNALQCRQQLATVRNEVAEIKRQRAAAKKAAEEKRFAEQKAAEEKRLAEEKAVAERKAAEYRALLATGTAGALFVLGDELEVGKDHTKATEVYRALIQRFPEAPVAAEASVRIRGMREQTRLAAEREQQAAAAAAAAAAKQKEDEERKAKDGQRRQVAYNACMQEYEACKSRCSTQTTINTFSMLGSLNQYAKGNRNSLNDVTNKLSENNSCDCTPIYSRCTEMQP